MESKRVLKPVSVIDANRLDRVTLKARTAVPDTIYLSITDNVSGTSKEVVLEIEGILQLHDWLEAWIRESKVRGG